MHQLKYSIVFLLLIGYHSTVYSQHSTISSDLNLFIKKANLTIVTNELNKAFNTGDNPIFPDQIFDDYTKQKLMNIWKKMPFKVLAFDSLYNSSRLKFSAAESEGLILLKFKKNGIIDDLNFLYNIKTITRNLHELNTIPLTDSNSKLPHYNFTKGIKNPAVKKKALWEIGIGAGYGVVAYNNDSHVKNSGISLEFLANYHISRKIYISSAAGISRFNVRYQQTANNNIVNKVFYNLRLSATYTPFSGIMTEIGLSQTLGGFNGFGLMFGLGYLFIEKIGISCRYSYYGSYDQSILSFHASYLLRL